MNSGLISYYSYKTNELIEMIESFKINNAKL